MAAFKIAPPKNGIYVVQGEMQLVVTAMRRSSRWTTHLPQEEEQDPFLVNFSRLKAILNSIAELGAIEPNVFLGPFLDVIRSDDTTGPITGLALSSVNKFLSYGLLDPSIGGAAQGIENIADAVTHTRFVGTDPSSDEVVLMKILQVLRTLLLTPVGMLLSNEAVCEIMPSCFRICFELRLSELLRKSAEHTLNDMVQLLFSRLPQFKEEKLSGVRKLKMRAGGIGDSSRRRRSRQSPKVRQGKNRLSTTPIEETSPSLSAPSNGPSPSAAAATVVSPQSSGPASQAQGETGSVQSLGVAESIPEESSERDSGDESQSAQDLDRPSSLAIPETGEGGVDGKDASASECETPQMGGVISVSGEQRLDESKTEDGKLSSADQEMADSGVDGAEDTESNTDSASLHESEYVNPQGIRFTPQQKQKHGAGPPIPYGLPCVRELLRFLISLINPHDRHNTDLMMHMGLSLLTIAVETGCDHIPSFSTLIALIKDEMCKNLFALLQTERLSIFAASLRVCFFLFESMRTHLKLQLEMFIQKLTGIIVSESQRIPYEQKEMALDTLVQLWKIPSLVSELYLNYDCDLYCSNLFDNLTNLLSKNAFPVSGSLYTTHLLSLDALLAVVDSIEASCQQRILSTMSSVTSDATERFATTVPDSGVMIQVQEPNEENGSESPSHHETSDSESTRSDHYANVGPPTTGYAMGQIMAHALKEKELEGSPGKEHAADKPKTTPSRKQSRFSSSPNLPTQEELAQLKHRKKLLNGGTELFNQKPSKGIAFLQENGLLPNPSDPQAIAAFIKDNPHVDKKQIGEYISAKKNAKILDPYLDLFGFANTRVDEALRMLLEAFRLPGEAPVIQHLLECFADKWHTCNGHPFANHDAAFTLAYAIIMLNVDQHNDNAKKQNIPMTLANFKKNVSKVNGGNDFDQDMLGEIYNAIKNEEIVMPAEQSGQVKENYLWKVLLKRGQKPGSEFLHIDDGHLDKDLFLLAWGPTVAALSFVFDKSMDDSITQKALAGFRKCAMISAHYGLTDVFDNLVISLCKFTTLLNSLETPEATAIAFGSNMKAQVAAKTVFSLAHRHGDILAEGWKNLLDCMLQLFRAKLLPSEMVEVMDFVDPSGRISLIREEMPTVKSDMSLLGSFYSYFSPDSSAPKGPTPEDQEAIEEASNCVEDCHPEHLITESKFLRLESLQELVKALVCASQGPEAVDALGLVFDEEAAIFNLELLLRVILENRDRVSAFWTAVRDHFYTLVVTISTPSYLVERAIVGLLRLAIRLLRREEFSGQVLTSLRMLLMMKQTVIFANCRQIAFGLFDLLRTNAANIHSSQDWFTLFSLLECVGAGAALRPLVQQTNPMEDSGSGEIDQRSLGEPDAQSDSELSASRETLASDHGYTSDSELYRKSRRSGSESEGSTTSSWLVVKNSSEESSRPLVNQFQIALEMDICHHDTKSLTKCCESLAFLVRDAAHVTPANFESCVHAIRMFVEATVNGGKLRHEHRKHPKERKSGKSHKGSARVKGRDMSKTRSVPDKMSQMMGGEGDEGEDDGPPGGYQALSIQLLDLMHTLHTRAASIFSSWAEEEEREGQQVTIDAGASALWVKCWCPLLQGIARLCCDTRRQVRMQALTYLQRALLVHDLQTLSAVEWESCFNKVLFPLLTLLLEDTHDPVGMEETRMRAATLLCKVFLQHLTPLLSLSTFTALWLTILDFMDKYMHSDKSDLLFEAIPESLKNMLLVMDTAGVFGYPEPGSQSHQLWINTWERIDCFLPGLRNQVFTPQETAPVSKPKSEANVPKPDVIPRDGAVSPIQNGPSQAAPDNPDMPATAQQPSPRSGTPSPSPATQSTDATPPPLASSPSPPPPPPPQTTPATPDTVQSNIILQPPLPHLMPPGTGKEIGGTIPILLDPSVLQGSPVPFIAVSQSQTATTGSS
ncbi:Golgi-specific brefeldin A-resistance guanine nucleotide exchange factor 1 isoform X1 [Strongylocentrotus purpuratus]|uniref:SEC7 domain-containing protein n=1 Tax=Strongylocentrotus purpuratus TaxID=7668 RepID=A0A7M7NI93_STRPU|nr:Golgi-specific brefeldin A-resistance guanine nucleotide exchange factor 1 isoform X1 [Strongylocentrotus purpuratus]